MYNGAAFLRESVESILTQDWSDFELIISDNCSTDGSDTIAREFAAHDPRIRFMRQSVNRGAAANFNLLFPLGSAPYFKWACADDVLASGFLRRAVAELDAQPEAVLCYGQTTFIDAAGKSMGPCEQGLNLRSTNALARFQSARDRRGFLNVLQGVMRASALAGTRLLGTFPGSDEALVVELALHGTFREIAAPMLGRRMHAAAASAGKTHEDRLDHLAPQLRDRVQLNIWRHSIEHVRAAFRAPLTFRQRLRAVGIVLRSMVKGRVELRWEVTQAIRTLSRRWWRRSTSH